MFEKALMIDPNNVASMFHKGVMLFKLEEFK